MINYWELDFRMQIILQEEIMSRTYRKRKGQPFWWTEEEFNREREDYLNSNNKYRRWYYKDTFKAELRVFHSDSYDMDTPDTEFRKLYGHKHDRARTKECLHKEMIAVDRGDVIFPKTRDIAWEWD